MNIQKISNSLSSFIKRASKNPLWAFGWVIFAASLTFVVNYYLDYPNQLAQIDSNTARFNTYTQDYDESLQVLQILDKSYSIFVPIVDEYNNIGNKITNNENVPQKQIDNAISQAQDARITLSTFTGTLKGITFNDDTLDKYVQEFAQNISEKEKVVSSILDFYQGGLARDRQKVIDSITFLKNFSNDVYQQEAENTERLKNFQDEFKNFHAKNTIEIKKETDKLSIFSVKSNIVIIAAIYSVVFPVFGAYVWIKNSRSTSKGKYSKPKQQKNRK